MKIQSKNERGVTLTELMVVVAIIAVGAAIAIPTYVNYLPLLKVRTAARELISDLRYARQNAITMNTRHRVIFTSATVYEVQRDSSTGWSSTQTLKTVDLVQIASGTVLSSTEDIAYFLPNGGVDTAGGRNDNVTAVNPLVLTLTHADGQYRNVNVNLVGRVWTE